MISIKFVGSMIANSDSKLFGKNINPKRKKTQTSLVVNTSLVAALAGAVPAISGVGWDKSFHVPENFHKENKLFALRPVRLLLSL